jgi:hypothetical protein
METDSKINKEKESWCFKQGASALFKGFHLPHLNNLFIPWCFQQAYVNNPKKYHKDAFA